MRQLLSDAVIADGSLTAIGRSWSAVGTSHAKSCKSLVEVSEAEVAGKDIVMRRWPALNLLHVGSTMVRR